MTKILIVTYYWHPAAGGFVQRVSKFCKYLPEFGYEPVILTVADGTYANRDEGINDDIRDVKHVYRATSWEPHNLYHRLTGRQHEPGNTGPVSAGRAKTSNVHRLAEWIRLNAFIPDARIGWLPGARRLGLQAIQEHQPALIFSTAPPFTVQLVGRALHRRTRLPWIADYRDPWLENVAYTAMHRFGFVKALNRRMEVSTYRESTRVVCVGQRQLDVQARKVEPAVRERFRLIRNGYDADHVPATIERLPRFTLSYFGSLYPQRFPDRLVDGIEQAMGRSMALARDFECRLVGQISPEIVATLAKRLGEKHLKVQSFQPLAEINRMLYQEQVLLLTVNRAALSDLVVPGKIYEHLPTGNPTLAIGPVDGEADILLREHDGGSLFDYEDAGGIAAFLLRAHADWQQNRLNRGPRELPLLQRRHQTGQLAALFDDVLAAKAASSA